MGEGATTDDYSGLGLLMRQAGVAPERVEDMVRQFLTEELGGQACRECALEVRALRECVGDGVDAMRVDQNAALTTLGASLVDVSSQIGAMPRASGSRRLWPDLLLVIIIVLQLAVFAACFAVYSALADTHPLLQPASKSSPCPTKDPGQVYAA